MKARFERHLSLTEPRRHKQLTRHGDTERTKAGRSSGLFLPFSRCLRASVRGRSEWATKLERHVDQVVFAVADSPQRLAITSAGFADLQRVGCGGVEYRRAERVAGKCSVYSTSFVLSLITCTTAFGRPAICSLGEPRRGLAAVVVLHVDHHRPALELRAGFGGVGQVRPAVDGDAAVRFVEPHHADAGGFVVHPLVVSHRAA